MSTSRRHPLGPPSSSPHSASSTPTACGGVTVIRSKGSVPAAVHIEGSAVRKKYSLEAPERASGQDNNTQDHSGPRQNREWTQLIQHEVFQLCNLRHPNVMSLLSARVEGPEVVLTLPYMGLGSVEDLIHYRYSEGLPEPAVAVIMRDVLQALAYLHDKAIVHRSVRGSHVLLSDSGVAKLSGLRYSCSLLNGGGPQDRYDYPLHVAKNNLNWLSPEFLQQNLYGYNERLDIYSVAVTACEAANGIVPYADMAPTLMFLEKLRGTGPKLLDKNTIGTNQNNGGGQLPAADSGVGASVGSCSNVLTSIKSLSAYRTRQFTPAFYAFVEQCSQLDPDDRPSSRDLVHAPHAFFKQLKKNSTLLSLPSWRGEAAAVSQKRSMMMMPASNPVHIDSAESIQWDF